MLNGAMVQDLFVDKTTPKNVLFVVECGEKI